MTELDDLEEIADKLKPDRSRTPTPGLVRASGEYFKKFSALHGKSIRSRVRSSRANRKVPITLAGNTGRVG